MEVFKYIGRLLAMEEEDGQAVRSADSKNWWPGFQGGPTAYVWHELPSAIAPILDSFPSAASPRL